MKQQTKKQTQKQTKKQTIKYSRRTKKNNPTLKEQSIQLFENANKTKLLLMPYRNETQTASIFFYFKWVVKMRLQI